MEFSGSGSADLSSGSSGFSGDVSASASGSSGLGRELSGSGLPSGSSGIGELSGSGMPSGSSGIGGELSGSGLPSGSSGIGGEISGSGMPSGSSGSGGELSASGLPSGSSGFEGKLSGSGWSSGSSGVKGDFSGFGLSGDMSGSGSSGDGSDINVSFSGTDTIFPGDVSTSGTPQEAGEGSAEILTFMSGLGSGFFSGDGSGSGSGSSFGAAESGSTTDIFSILGESGSGEHSGLSSGLGSSGEYSGFSGFPSGSISSGEDSGFSGLSGSGIMMMKGQWVEMSTAPTLTAQELGGSQVHFSGSGDIQGSGLSGSGVSGSDDISGSGSGSGFPTISFLDSGLTDLIDLSSREQEASGILIYGSGEGSGDLSRVSGLPSGDISESSASGNLISYTDESLVEVSFRSPQNKELRKGPVELSGRESGQFLSSGHHHATISSEDYHPTSLPIEDSVYVTDEPTVLVPSGLFGKSVPSEEILANAGKAFWKYDSWTPATMTETTTHPAVLIHTPTGIEVPAMEEGKGLKSKDTKLMRLIVSRFYVLLNFFKCFSLCLPSTLFCILAGVDPCSPNPCGAAAVCSVQDGIGVCHCPPGVNEEECHVGKELKLALVCFRSASHPFNVVL